MQSVSNLQTSNSPIEIAIDIANGKGWVNQYDEELTQAEMLRPGARGTEYAIGLFDYEGEVAIAAHFELNVPEANLAAFNQMLNFINLQMGTGAFVLCGLGDGQQYLRYRYRIPMPEEWHCERQLIEALLDQAFVAMEEYHLAFLNVAVTGDLEESVQMCIEPQHGTA